MNRPLDLFFNNFSMLLLWGIIIVISIGNILLISTTINYLEKEDYSFSNFAYGQSYLQKNNLPHLLSAYDSSNNAGNHSTTLYLEKLFTYDDDRLERLYDSVQQSIVKVSAATNNTKPHFGQDLFMMHKAIL